MQCPRDGVTLDHATKQGVEIDICPACGGLWCDPGEIEAAEKVYAEVTRRVPAAPDEMTAGLRMAAEKQSPPTHCPVCEAENVREEYGLASQVLVDRCPDGHGVWLDRGELEAIEHFYARERAESTGSVLVEFLQMLGLSWD